MLKLIKLFFYLILGLIFSVNYSNLKAENINFKGYSFSSKDSLGPVSKTKDKRNITPKPNEIQSQSQSQSQSQISDSSASADKDKDIKQEELIGKDTSKVQENIDPSDKLDLSSSSFSSSLNSDNLLDKNNNNNALSSSKKTKTPKLNQDSKKASPIKITKNNKNKNKTDALVDSSKNPKTSKEPTIISIKAKAKHPSLPFDRHPMKIGISYLND